MSVTAHSAGQDGAGQAEQGGAVRDDTDHVGTTPDLLVEPRLRVVRPDLTLLGKAATCSSKCRVIAETWHFDS
jgi:hypothetical protein